MYRHFRNLLSFKSVSEYYYCSLFVWGSNLCQAVTNQVHSVKSSLMRFFNHYPFIRMSKYQDLSKGLVPSSYWDTDSGICLSWMVCKIKTGHDKIFAISIFLGNCEVKFWGENNELKIVITLHLTVIRWSIPCPQLLFAIILQCGSYRQSYRWK